MLNIDQSHRSPNHSLRHGAAIELIVVHATVGSFDSALAWLCNPASRVSSHYLIRKDGYIAQLVPDSEQAWHAGASVWNGHYDCNEISLGIELENLAGMKLDNGTLHGADPYPQAQVDALTALCRDLMGRYHLDADRLVRHLDIAIPKGRKTDPYGFPWEAWLANLTSPLVWQVQAGPRGAIAQQDRRPDAPAAGVWYSPGAWIQVDDLTAGYYHAQDGIGFIPAGHVIDPRGAK